LEVNHHKQAIYTDSVPPFPIIAALSTIREVECLVTNEDAAFKIFRVLRDGGELFVAGRENLTEAKKCVAKFIDRWPGKYVIHGPESLNLVIRPTY
jgi:hypothetical protein